MYARQYSTDIKTSHYTHQKGFSLLELMFVILLISTIAVSTGLYIKNTNEKSAAKKVASQMVYWLNSASTYYSAQGKWPDSLAALASAMGVQLSSSQPYTLQASDNAQGSSVSIVLPSLSFARLVQAQLARAIIDDSNPNKITLYAYTPPLATALSPNAQVKGVGNLTFYNCRYNGNTSSNNFKCSKVTVSGSNQAPCVDPLNNHPYSSKDTKTYQSSSDYLYQNYSGLCALPVPQCSAGSIPQIYYAISQFRAPSYTEDPKNNSSSHGAHHPYQLYPYQVNAICQTIDSKGNNFGPCGPNLADDTVYDSIKNSLYPIQNSPSSNPLYFSFGFNARNYQFNLGVTYGVEYYHPPNTVRPRGPRTNGNADWAGSFYDEQQYYWSAIVSYVIACVPRENINNFVDGGTVYYLNGSDTMPNAGSNKVKTDQGVTAYSQSMLTQ